MGLTSSVLAGGWAGRLTRVSAKHTRTVLSLWCLLLSLSTIGLSLLAVDTSTSSFLDRSGPAWAAYQASVRDFGGDEFLVVAFHRDSTNTNELLHNLQMLSDRYSARSDVRRVDSVSTIPLIRRTEAGDVAIDPLIHRDALASQLPPELFIDQLRHDRLMSDNIVSKDGETFAVNLVLEGDASSNRNEIVADVGRAVAGKGALLSGVPIFRTAVNARTIREVTFLVPVTVGAIALLVFVSLRSFLATAIVIGSGSCGVLVALGLMGFSGRTLSLSTMILPSTLLALGCAYSAHPLLAWLRGEGIEGLVRTSAPVAVSGITTALGFFAMSTAGVDAIKDLATFGAVGVAAITAANLTALPAVLSKHRSVQEPVPRLSCAGALTQRIVDRFVLGHPRLTILAWIATATFCALGLYRLSVETDIIRWFSRDTAIRRDYETIRRDLSGITPVNVVVQCAPGTEVVDPVCLSAISELSAALSQLEVVGRSLSIVDPLLELHDALASDSHDLLTLSRESLEQYLLLLEGVPLFDDLLTRDRHQANILLRLDNNSSHEIVELGDWVHAWWSTNSRTSGQVTVTGVMYEFARSEEAIARGQIIGLLLAGAMVYLVLLVALGSVRAGSVALIPNMIPIVAVYGTMGWLSIPLDAATACLGSLAIGIAVDDTVHVASGYVRRTKDGHQGRRAIQRTIREVSPALIITSVAISVGFSMLYVSEFTLVSNLGVVTAALVLVALLADLTLLPALLYLGGQRRIK